MPDEELMSRQMPHSLEAEQSVLGSMLIDSRCIPDVIEALEAGDFYMQQNRDIYEAIYSMFVLSQPIDAVTVLNRMRENGTYDENNTRGYVLQIIDVTPTSANVMEYVAIVKDRSLLRQIAQTAGDITGMIQRSEGSGQDILEAAEQRIYAIRQGRGSRGLIHISAVMQDVFARLEELSASDQAVPGISTGLTALDKAISGLNNSDLILLAARPGMGKTSLAPEHPAPRRQALRQVGGVFLAGDEPGAAGYAAAVQRIVHRQQKAHHRPAGPGGLGQHRFGQRRPEQDQYSAGRQPLPDGGGYAGQVPPGGQPGPGLH